MTGIYKITNPLGEIYIGQSIDIKKRFSNHKAPSKNNNSKLSNSFKLHGIESHTFEIEMECEKEALDFNEGLCIRKYRSHIHGLNKNMSNRLKDVYVKKGAPTITNGSKKIQVTISVSLEKLEKLTLQKIREVSTLAIDKEFKKKTNE